MFNKATKRKSKLRLLLEGPSGSGKTYSALILASGIGSKVAVLDTEKGSASLYSSTFDFDTCELSPPYSPESYIEAIKFAEESGYDVLVIDSLTHEWSGEGGCLDIQTKLGGRYQDWARVTPRHQKFIEAILQSDIHIIATARTKSDYSMDKVGGKIKVTKLGTKTEQRDGLEFEFTTCLRLNQNNMFESSKDRTNLFNGVEGIIGPEHPKMLIDWLNDGIDPLKEAEDRLCECVTLDELKNAWLSTPVSLKLKLEDIKNKIKSEIDISSSIVDEEHQ